MIFRLVNKEDYQAIWQAILRFEFLCKNKELLILLVVGDNEEEKTQFNTNNGDLARRHGKSCRN
ncbi:hypothetical protein [Ruoffia tabacinasalis]|uniref:hypothetical protein n=1 Tax=Ruoffia tabacinasalis TaxID=87458 RepID=UPI0030D2A668